MQVLDELRDREQPDQGGQEVDAGEQIGVSEGEARGAHHGVLPDRDDEQPEDGRQQPLHQRARGEAADHRQAEQCDGEEILCPELQGEIGEARGDEVQAGEAEQAAGEAGRDGDPERASRLAGPGHRVAVQRGGRRRRGAGNVEQHGGEAATGHPRHVEPEQQGDGDVRLQHEGERQDDDDAAADREPGDHAHDETEHDPGRGRAEARRQHGLREALQDVFVHGSSIRPAGRMIWKPWRNSTKTRIGTTSAPIPSSHHRRSPNSAMSTAKKGTVAARKPTAGRASV